MVVAVARLVDAVAGGAVGSDCGSGAAGRVADETAADKTHGVAVGVGVADSFVTAARFAGVAFVAAAVGGRALASCDVRSHVVVAADDTVDVALVVDGTGGRVAAAAAGALVALVAIAAKASVLEVGCVAAAEEGWTRGRVVVAALAAALSVGVGAATTAALGLDMMREPCRARMAPQLSQSS